jgi:hypothetical protein
MFKERPNYKLPEKLDVPIWRYMDVARLISMLENSALYFCRADKLGDRFECSLPSAFFDKVMAEPESKRQFMQRRQADVERLKEKHQEMKRDIERAGFAANLRFAATTASDGAEGQKRNRVVH